jgi:hypothetical protein
LARKRISGSEPKMAMRSSGAVWSRRYSAIFGASMNGLSP